MAQLVLPKSQRKKEMKLFEKIGGRKFVFFIVTVIVGVIVDIKAKNGLSVNLKDLLIYAGAIYAAGNVGEHVASVIRSKNNKETQLQLDAVAASMDQLNQQQAAVLTNLNTNTQATGEVLRRVSGGE